VLPFPLPIHGHDVHKKNGGTDLESVLHPVNIVAGSGARNNTPKARQPETLAAVQLSQDHIDHKEGCAAHTTFKNNGANSLAPPKGMIK